MRPHAPKSGWLTHIQKANFMHMKTLQCFIAAAEEKTIADAAARLDLSPSALVRQICSLEDELDLPLFASSFPHFWLTAAGAAFLPHAQEILLEYELAVEEIGNLIKA